MDSISTDLRNNYFIPTDPAIKNSIHSIWQVDRDNTFYNEYIIPKGQVEVIFNIADEAPIVAELNDNRFRLPKCFINGFNKTPIQLQLPAKQIFLGIVIQPMAVKKIFGSPAGEFSGLTVDLSLVNTVFNSLHDQLAEQIDFSGRVNTLLEWIKRTINDPDPREQLLNHFLYTGSQHNLNIKAIAQSLCFSTRHLSRKIMEATGMNTEEIVLYKKYLHSVHLIQHTNLSLTAIAYQSNFSDQSHFIKSFKAYTGMTPGNYREKKSHVTGHLYYNVR